MINIEEKIKEIAVQKDSLRKMVETDVFRNGIHYRLYGKNMRLLLAGVELLKNIHGLEEVDVRIESTMLDSANREYQCYSTMKSADGAFFGTGLRVCSTKEEKFCYEFKKTEEKLRSSWFKNRAQLDIKGNTEGDPYKFVVRETGGKAAIFERIPTLNPAKHYNMVASLSHKRAQMAAVINAIGASDLFEIEGEVLTVDYAEYLAEREAAEAKEVDPEGAETKLAPSETIDDRRYHAICEKHPKDLSALLLKQKRIKEGDTCHNLSGKDRDAVLMNLTYLEEKFK